MFQLKVTQRRCWKLHRPSLMLDTITSELFQSFSCGDKWSRHACVTCLVPWVCLLMHDCSNKLRPNKNRNKGWVLCRWSIFSPPSSTWQSHQSVKHMRSYRCWSNWQASSPSLEKHATLSGHLESGEMRESLQVWQSEARKHYPS